MKIRILFFISTVFFLQQSYAQFPGWQWAKTSVNGAGDASGRGVVTDYLGNVYVTGIVGATSTFGNTTLNCVGNGDVLLVKYDPFGNVIWAKSAGGSGNDFAYGIAIDANANVYITGMFDSPAINFGSITLTNADTNNDIFLVKYDSSGNALWAKNVAGTTLDDYSTSVAVDLNGDVCISGWFRSPSIVFGTTTLTSIGGGANFFLAKYDSIGNSLWAKGGGNAFSESNGVAFDSNGNIFITGSFGGTATFGSISLSATTPAFFVAKYNPGGTALWAQKGDAAYDGNAGKSVATDADGNVYAAGYFDGYWMNLNSYQLNNTVGDASLSNIFLAKYDSSGTLTWAKSLGAGDGDDAAESVSTDSIGNIYMAGWFISSSLHFDTTGTILLYNCCSGGSSIFIAKYDSGGTAIWAKNEDGGGSWNEAHGVVPDRNGNVFLTGFYGSSPMTLGSTTLPIVGGASIFLAKVGSPLSVTSNQENKVAGIVYPSPTTGNISIQINSSIGGEIQIEVIDVFGQTVLRRVVENNSDSSIENIDVSSFIDGVYFASIKENGILIGTQKFIKEH